MSKRKLNVLSLSDKLKIVNAFESGKSRNQILCEFGLAESTYYRIIKSKELIKSQCAEGNENIKRSRLCMFPDVEKCLLEWIKQTLDKNVPINGPLLKQKFKDFATKLGITNSSASNGWLEGFKKRHGISFMKTVSESKTADQRICNQWTEDLPSLLRGYDPNDIYNADETALFFKCLPDQTIFNGEKCHGEKQSTERFTILHCVNMTGTDKLPLLIIGKSKRPRCFQDVKTLPVDYESNVKAWMTKNLFKDWLKKVDKQMKIKRQKIVLFVDNCPAHTDLPTLENIKVVFWPANTSNLQPLDQGIVHTFKRFYRRQVVEHTLTCMVENLNPEINVLLAMKFARRAWNAVSDVTIKNCFKKAGFGICLANEDLLTEQHEVELENEVEVGPSYDEWAVLVSHNTDVDESTPTFEDFVRIDDHVSTSGEYTDDDLVQICVSPWTDGDDSEDEASQSHILDREMEKIPNKQEALNALETLHKFFEHTAVDRTVFDIIYELQKHAQNVKTDSQ